MNDNRRGVGTTFYKKRGENTLVIHQLNLTVPMLKGDVHPMKGGTLRISEDYFQLSACRRILPAGRQIRIRNANSFSVLELPDVDTHSVFVLNS